MQQDIRVFNNKQEGVYKEICDKLCDIINRELPDAEGKVWHGHPVWFLNGNPVAGYVKQKAGIRLMFWSGADFEEDKLINSAGKFKDASIFFNDMAEINEEDLNRWLKKSIDIQWDYKNLVKRKGKLEKLK